MKAGNRLLHWAINPLVFLFFAGAVLLSYLYADKAIARYFYSINAHQLFFWMAYLTVLGKWTGYFVLFFLMALYFRYIRPHPVWEARCWFLFATILIPNLICLGLKIGFGRARPELWFSQDLFGFYWFKFNKLYWSFPSGHATTITSLMIGLSLIFYRYFWPLFLLCLLVIATRVVMYDHYLSDVLTAFYLTLLELSVFYHFARQRGWFKGEVR